MALVPILAAMAIVYVPVKTVVAEVTLNAPVKVPDPQSIRPYRGALVAGEYTVQRVLKGSDPELKKGAKIRIFRWGIREAKPTALAKTKKGQKVKLTLGRLSGWEEMEREYQVDDLDVDLAATYFVEVYGGKK